MLRAAPCQSWYLATHCQIERRRDHFGVDWQMLNIVRRLTMPDKTMTLNPAAPVALVVGLVSRDDVFTCSSYPPRWLAAATCMTDEKPRAAAKVLPYARETFR
jgi:hypothetical protein